MVGVCFYHTDFDRDVSSGTSHSLQQWTDLLQSFNVSDIAVINQTKDSVPYKSYPDLKSFLDEHWGQNIAFTKASGSVDHRKANYSKIDWLIFGTYESWNFDGISIDTHEEREVYPREAAAIILSEARWQLR